MDSNLIVDPSSTISHDQVLGTNTDCIKTHQLSSPTPHAAIRLPVEILRVVVELTMPPPLRFLNSTIISRDNRYSRYCTLLTLRNLVLVCKYWYDVGISLLYRRAVILRSEQLFILTRAVSRNHSLGKMIISLHLEWVLSVSQLATVSTAARSLFAVTPNLTQITLAPMMKRQPFLSLAFLRLLTLAQNTPSRTTDLHLRITRMLKYTLELMPAFTYLTTFHIDVILRENDELPTEHLHLPFLEELQITWNSSEHGIKVCSALAEILTLSSLRRLLLTSQALEDGMFFEPLLRKFGPGLHFISLVRPYIHDRYRVYYDFRRPIPLAPSLSMCPNLRHLVMDTCIPIQVPAHAHLTWVDLWAPRQCLDPGEQSAVTLVPHDERAKLPSLRGVRLLDMSLFSYSDARTPLLIPPYTVRSTESVVWSYPSLQLRHDSGLLYRQNLIDDDDVVLAQSLEQRL
ncbi:hypothetical protein DEU56DRAFT_913439 [Suillus clintonianus]|uniref:uncharacterized protein n=1 Tax=Suillus clintonianus TaxID=1904413 RepID=UPI001B8720C8|nr:uncharacterized protein DEU56DRAFT_913439 [Suillus clintonianus]KAG2135333.1 hypothetical protein DEU56DRAFT_913439 [Suillus clintonianus]